jgi:cell wall-active antibiotic response 4TMS protein YvqF
MDPDPAVPSARPWAVEPGAGVRLDWEVMMKPFRVWIGAVLVAFGLLWLLDAVGVLAAGPLIGRWWPLAIVALGGLAVVAGRRLTPGAVALILVGGGLLVSRLSMTDVGRVFWPGLAVVVGGWLLMDFARRHDHDANVADREDVFALLGGSRVINRSPRFRHANVSAILGGATLDLREAGLDTGARIDALALFGGVEVIVPPGWRVHLSGLPLFGGYQDKTSGRDILAADAPVLTVVATAVFGGVEVKHGASPSSTDTGTQLTSSTPPGSDLR